MDQTQLLDAAKEFGKDYHDGYRIPDNLAQLVLDGQIPVDWRLIATEVEG